MSDLPGRKSYYPPPSHLPPTTITPPPLPLQPPTPTFCSLLHCAHQVWKWQAVRVETQVTVNCSARGNLTYKWQVHRLSGQSWGGKRTLESLDPDLLVHPDLLLPPHALSIGQYVVSLKVSVVTLFTLWWYGKQKLTSSLFRGSKFYLVDFRAGIAQLVVLGLAVHSVAGSILLWGHFPVEGIFPLELTWVQTPFPPKLFRMRV